MKTPDEIKKGLECCDKQACEECPYDECGDDSRLCMPVLIEDSFELVQQLEVKAVKQSQRIAELEQDLAAVMRERDAAVADIKTSQSCSLCIHCPKDDECETALFLCMECDKVGCVCRECFHGEKLEWRGICPENTEVSPDA